MSLVEKAPNPYFFDKTRSSDRSGRTPASNGWRKIAGGRGSKQR
jgi:hypothetical protein